MSPSRRAMLPATALGRGLSGLREDALASRSKARAGWAGQIRAPSDTYASDSQGAAKLAARTTPATAASATPAAGGLRRRSGRPGRLGASPAARPRRAKAAAPSPGNSQN